MYYEEKWVDGWLWYRHATDGPWVTASEEHMIGRMRKSLELVIEATDIARRQKVGCSVAQDYAFSRQGRCPELPWGADLTYNVRSLAATYRKVSLLHARAGDGNRLCRK